MKSLYSLPLVSVLVALTLCPALSSAQSLPLAAVAVSLPSPAYYYAAVNHPYSSSSSAAEFALAAPAAASASAAPAAPAASGGGPFSSVGVGVQLGLGGIGFNVATPLLPGRLNLRGGAGFLSYTYNGTVSNEPVTAKLSLNNAEVMVDWFPFKGSFRLSAGTTVYNTTGINGTVSVAPATTLKIGNSYYLSDSSPNQLTGNLALGLGGKAVPRFTLGWGNMVANNHHIRFETEFGVEIIGTPTVSWSYAGEACPVSSSTSTSCNEDVGYESINSIPGVSTDIANQVATLQSDVNSVKILPVFSIGLSYKIGH